MKNFLRSILSLLFITSLACGSSEGDDGGQPTIDLEIGITSLTVIDNENSGDASDIWVKFSPSANETEISEYRIIIAKNSVASAITSASASALSAGSYHAATPTGSIIEIDLSASLTDSDGQAIAEGVVYRTLVLTVAKTGSTATDHLFLSDAQLELAKTDILETIVELPIGTGGVVVDAEGNIYCADFGQSLQGPPGTTIYKISPAGETSVFATGFVGASGNTFATDGTLYQSNIQGGTVSKVSTDGTVTNFVSGMAAPVGLIFDPAGNLYVANCGDNTVKKVTPEGVVSTFASGAMLNCPNGIAIDDNDNLYVANFSDGNVVKVTPQGLTSVFATLPGNNNGHITFHNNRFYVIARGANQVYELDMNGNSTLLAGSGQRGHDDGAALLSTLSLPNDLGFSPDGKYLYINDTKPLGGFDIQPTYLKRIRLEKD